MKAIVVEHLGVEADKVSDTASFIDDLGADSLDTVELVMAFEEEFGSEISDSEAEKILIDELPVIPLYTYTRTYLLSQRVKNWQNNILDTNPYQFLSLE